MLHLYVSPFEDWCLFIEDFGNQIVMRKANARPARINTIMEEAPIAVAFVVKIPPVKLVKIETNNYL